MAAHSDERNLSKCEVSLEVEIVEIIPGGRAVHRPAEGRSSSPAGSRSGSGLTTSREVERDGCQLPQLARDRASGPTHDGCEALRDVRQGFADTKQAI
jgi:hypothetical protein